MVLRGCEWCIERMCVRGCVLEGVLRVCVSLLPIREIVIGPGKHVRPKVEFAGHEPSSQIDVRWRLVVRWCNKEEGYFVT